LEKIEQKLKLEAVKLNWNGTNFPVSWHDIDKFERRNGGLSVNVFRFDGEVYPLRLSSKVKDSNIVDMLLISEGSTQYYCLIKSLCQLLNTQTGGHTLHYCRRCLLGYRQKDALAKPEEYCKEHDAVKINLPEPDSILKFMSHNRSMRVPFIEYAPILSHSINQLACVNLIRVNRSLINTKSIYLVHSVTM